MAKKSGAPHAPEAGGQEEDFVDLRLYVTDRTPRCLTAYENIRKICEEHVRGSYRITVIDLLRVPEIARQDDITAIPTLVRLLPRNLGAGRSSGCSPIRKRSLKSWN